jgi:uncharacterized protein YeaO (DUF488 family)
MKARKPTRPAAKVETSQVPPHPDPDDPDHQEWVIDEGDEESFPASDPSAATQPHRRSDRNKTPSHGIQIKRTYDPPARGDGRRILVERLWPRGMKKESLQADAWLKDVAPSTELRKWFDHRVERWKKFEQRYRDELKANSAAWQPILEAAKRGRVTLLYSAHDQVHNGAVVLRDFLLARAK